MIKTSQIFFHTSVFYNKESGLAPISFLRRVADFFHASSKQIFHRLRSNIRFVTCDSFPTPQTHINQLWRWQVFHHQKNVNLRSLVMIQDTLLSLLFFWLTLLLKRLPDTIYFIFFSYFVWSLWSESDPARKILHYYDMITVSYVNVHMSRTLLCARQKYFRVVADILFFERHFHDRISQTIFDDHLVLVDAVPRKEWKEQKQESCKASVRSWAWEVQDLCTSLSTLNSRRVFFLCGCVPFTTQNHCHTPCPLPATGRGLLRSPDFQQLCVIKHFVCLVFPTRKDTLHTHPNMEVSLSLPQPKRHFLLSPRRSCAYLVRHCS